MYRESVVLILSLALSLACGTSPGEGPGDASTDSQLSHERGFYQAPFELSITSLPTTRFFFTLDGSVPSEANGMLYSTPLQIERTTLFRFVEIQDGQSARSPITHSYLFLEDVLTQPIAPEGFPEQWQPETTADYQFDSSVGDKSELEDSLRVFPTLSLVMPMEQWFDQSPDPAIGGIYSNSQIARGRAWEKPVSAEFFDFAHGQTMHAAAGIRIFGNASRLTSRPKHNMRLIFRGEYGATKLRFPVFGDDSENDTVNSYLLRGQNGDSWFHPNAAQQAQALYLRDQLARRLHERMGQPEVSQGHINVYVNGLYWGLYNTIERIEDDSMAARFGGEKEDWDVLKSSRALDQMDVVNGNLDAWVELQTLAADVGAGNAPISALESELDFDNFIDFLLINFYNGNRDWDDNNFQTARRRTGDDRWRFFVWDSERTMLDVASDSTTGNFPNRATAIHNALLPLAAYRAKFAERGQLHLLGDGSLTPSVVRSELDAWVDELREPLLVESARWGDAHRPGVAHQVSLEWEAELTRLREQFIPTRTDVVIDQLRAQGLMP